MKPTATNAAAAKPNPIAVQSVRRWRTGSDWLVGAEDAPQGGAGVGTSVQLYMVPGMNHCQGGPGTDVFDKVGAIEEFIKTGIAPARIDASHRTNGVVDRTRPLCPFGQVAQWKGTGSTDDAVNFACVVATVGSPPAGSR